jgi:hypothetical protein
MKARYRNEELFGQKTDLPRWCRTSESSYNLPSFHRRSIYHLCSSNYCLCPYLLRYEVKGCYASAVSQAQIHVELNWSSQQVGLIKVWRRHLIGCQQHSSISVRNFKSGFERVCRVHRHVKCLCLTIFFNFNRAIFIWLLIEKLSS